MSHLTPEAKVSLTLTVEQWEAILWALNAAFKRDIPYPPRRYRMEQAEAKIQSRLDDLADRKETRS